MKKINTSIKPGDKVTHGYTGHTGIAMIVAQRINGTVMIAVQQQGLTPELKEHSAHWGPWEDFTTAPKPVRDPLLGAEGTDEQTKAVGRIVCVQNHIKGCKLVEFELKKLQKNGDPAADLLFDAARFKPKTPVKDADPGHGFINAGLAR